MTIDRDSKRNSKPDRPAKRVPKKITETYLHNSGLYYLQRFAAGKAHFRSVMLRKVRKSCMHHEDQDFDACAALVNQLADKFEQTGLLDDAAYVRGMVTSLRRRGLSQRAIVAKLAQKGIEQDTTLHALGAHDRDFAPGGDSDAEKRAALIFCRRKKIGPFATNGKKTHEQFMATLARAGFSFDTVRFVLNIDQEESQNILMKQESL
ncbi:MAG: hypothetical protein DHS20C02_11420 [Micavibrio sp.]|nr:MAG: hypothetical protein DHS20C02_11420 [Micavibrio sp.]